MAKKKKRQLSQPQTNQKDPLLQEEDARCEPDGFRESEVLLSQAGSGEGGTEKILKSDERESDNGSENVDPRLGGSRIHVETEDRWEYWSIASLILGAITLIFLVISMLGLGKWSVYLWIVGLVYCGLATIILGFLGLLRVVFRPPPIRRTRTIAFVVLLVVGTLGLMQPRLFGIPLSTDDWSSDVPITLPFDGEWVTLQGDDEQNYLKQMKMPPLKWSYLFGKTQGGMLVRKSDSEEPKLEDYYCWDQPVRAPVSGEVVDFRSGAEDMQMGESTREHQSSPLGNFVAIRFEEGGYLYVSGLKKDSVRLKPGDRVKQGDEIGRCGRSGFTLFPSVMMHGQNSVNFPYSEGLPIRFTGLKINGVEVEEGRPKGVEWRQDMVSAPNADKVESL